MPRWFLLCAFHQATRSLHFLFGLVHSHVSQWNCLRENWSANVKVVKLLCFGGAIIVVWYLRRYCSWTKLSEAAEEFAQKSQLYRCFPEILEQRTVNVASRWGGYILLFPLTPIDRGFIRFFYEGVGVELSPPVDFCSSNARKYLGPSDQLP